MTQPSLFDVGAVRDTDPDTSRDAALSMRGATGARECARVLGVVRHLCAFGADGVTAWEVARELDAQQNCVARRLRDLADHDLVVASGDRRPGPSGRLQQVWRLVP